MTRLEKRITFDMVLFFIILIVFWLTYVPKSEVTIMDRIWNIYVGGYMISSAASIYASIVTNKYLKDFCIFISFIRVSVTLYLIGSIIFGYGTVTQGPHLTFITISTIISFILSKSKLILPIRRFVEWLNLG